MFFSFRVLKTQFRKIAVNIMISMWRKHFSLFMFFVCDVARKNMCDRHRPLNFSFKKNLSFIFFTSVIPQLFLVNAGLFIYLKINKIKI